MLDIDFYQTDPQVICHPQYQELVFKILEGLKPYSLKNHFILFSSGTTGGHLKGYAISREALFTNARAVNEHFHLAAHDVWALSLPVYHIGGLSVVARAHLLGSKLLDARHWDPVEWIKKIEDTSITTIVPTQLYDLVKRGIRAPANLKYIVVGGDFLNSKLKSEALALGWPVIRTFGMSEVCSQLASATNPESDDLSIMPIHEVKTDSNQRLLVKGPALFTLQFELLNDQIKVTPRSELCDETGFYRTSDRALISGKTLQHLGRLGDEFKIAGHLVNINQLKNTLGSFLVEKAAFGKMEFSVEDDERKCKKLLLLTMPEAECFSSEISSLIHPVKIDEVRIVSNFERTALGKFKKG